jgi:hypothetical protein
MVSTFVMTGYSTAIHAVLRMSEMLRFGLPLAAKQL